MKQTMKACPATKEPCQNSRMRVAPRCRHCIMLAGVFRPLYGLCLALGASVFIRAVLIRQGSWFWGNLENWKKNHIIIASCLLPWPFLAL